MIIVNCQSKEARDKSVEQEHCQRVTGCAKVPANWQNVLANAENKKELFLFISKRAAEERFPDQKDLYITGEEQVQHVGDGLQMDQCNHEEADTRVLVHLLHALQTSTLGMVFTGDTDIVVILLSNFHHIKAANPRAEIWISFKVGKNEDDVPERHCYEFGHGVV